MASGWWIRHQNPPGEALQFASPSLRADQEVVLAAVECLAKPAGLRGDCHRQVTSIHVKHVKLIVYIVTQERRGGWIPIKWDLINMTSTCNWLEVSTLQVQPLQPYPNAWTQLDVTIHGGVHRMEVWGAVWKKRCVHGGGLVTSKSRCGRSWTRNEISRIATGHFKSLNLWKDVEKTRKTDGEFLSVIEAILLEFPICHGGLEAAW